MNERTWKQPDDKSNASAAASAKPGVNQTRDVSTGTTVRINYKHSLAIRWMHWINFPWERQLRKTPRGQRAGLLETFVASHPNRPTRYSSRMPLPRGHQKKEKA